MKGIKNFLLILWGAIITSSWWAFSIFDINNPHCSSGLDTLLLTLIFTNSAIFVVVIIFYIAENWNKE